MSWTSSKTRHLECDICHADGGTVTDEHPDVPSRDPDLPDGWRRVRPLDICAACIGSMTLPEYLAIADEQAQIARDERQEWDAREKQRRAALKAGRTAA